MLTTLPDDLTLNHKNNTLKHKRFTSAEKGTETWNAYFFTRWGEFRWSFHCGKLLLTFCNTFLSEIVTNDGNTVRFLTSRLDWAHCYLGIRKKAGVGRIDARSTVEISCHLL